MPTPRGAFSFPVSTYPYPPATPPLLAIRPRHICHPSTPNLPSGNAIFAIRQRPVCPPATPHLPSGNAILAIRQRQKCHPATPYLPSGNAPSTIRQRHTCHPATPNFDIRQIPICHPATPYLPSVNAIPALRQRQTCHLATPYIPSGNSIPASCRFRREGVVGLLSSRARQQAAKPAGSRITTPRKPPHHKPPIKDHKTPNNFFPKIYFFVHLPCHWQKLFYNLTIIKTLLPLKPGPGDPSPAVPTPTHHSALKLYCAKISGSNLRIKSYWSALALSPI